MSERSTSTRYREAVASFVEFARTLTADEWSTPVPCTPLWTARDVLSHVAGVPDDGLAGRVDGVATEPWTQSQVERNAGFSVGELLDRLLEQHGPFGEALDLIDEGRPPFDCHTHEHDIRHALGRPGNRESAIVDDATEMLLASLDATLADVGTRISITFDDGSVHEIGPADAPTAGVRLSKFEMFRSRLGRRSADQVRAFDWSGDDDAIDAALGGWFMFGPSEVAIDE